MTLSPERQALDHTTLMQVERTVEEVRRDLKDLTREVDSIDFEPSYTCDCSCDGEIQDLQSDVDHLTARIRKLEDMLTDHPG